MSFADQPTPRQLVANVITAARELSPRTILDPREGIKYSARLTSRVVKLQGGLVLWAMMTQRQEAPTESAAVGRIRSVA
jgi:hypothetical protein